MYKLNGIILKSWVHGGFCRNPFLQSVPVAKPKTDCLGTKTFFDGPPSDEMREAFAGFLLFNSEILLQGGWWWVGGLKTGSRKHWHCHWRNYNAASRSVCCPAFGLGATKLVLN